MTQDKQKYKKGDRVKVKYGHILWSNDKRMVGNNWKQIGEMQYDIRPELTEDIATVEYTYEEKFSKGDDDFNIYSLKFDKHGSISWFDEDHLIPVNPQP